MKKFRKKKEKRESVGSGHTFFKIIVLLILIAILGIGSLKGCQGFGGGKGEGDEDGKLDEKVENPISPEELTATPEITLTPSPTVTPAPKQLYVEIQQDIIVYQGKEFNTIQELMDEIRQESDEKENIIIILNDEMAIENTFEDVKNALEKEGILWITPTPVPSM